MRYLGQIFGILLTAACSTAHGANPLTGAPANSVTRPLRYTTTSAAGPRLLGMIAEPIRADRFAASLGRALADASRSPAMQRLIAPARTLNSLEQILYVQRAVSQKIRWESDATQWGQHDYWASASETLARGAGDMEDRAIVKMQALHTLGFRQSDVYLTLARDRVGGPMTVAMVRVGGQFLVLDDTGGTPFPIEDRRFEFRPLLSFGWDGAWIHVPAQAVASSKIRSAATR